MADGYSYSPHYSIQSHLREVGLCLSVLWGELTTAQPPLLQTKVACLSQPPFVRHELQAPHRLGAFCWTLFGFSMSFCGHAVPGVGPATLSRRWKELVMVCLQ